jgi:hypothetical protein
MIGIDRGFKVVFAVKFQDEFTIAHEENGLSAIPCESTARVSAVWREHQLDTYGLTYLAKPVYDDRLEVRHYVLSS